MTSHERDRFASLPPCGECEHPAGRHTAARGCWHCDCDEPPTSVDDAGAIYETAAAGIYATDVDYLLTPAALLAMGVRAATPWPRWCNGATTLRACRHCR